MPRSASFGSRSQFQKLQSKWNSCTAAMVRICQGDITMIKTAAVFASTAGIVIGLLGVLNPLAVISPLHLLTCVYLLVLSTLALALEVEAPFFEPFRRWVAFWMRALTQVTGRGALYLVLGSLAAGLGDPFALLAGLLLVGAGAACIRHAAGPALEIADEDSLLGPQSERGGSRPDARLDAPRMAFRRRVNFGMEHMDSAELVALCLELGLSLDARKRVAALAILDPDQQGTIHEDAFLLWWEQQHEPLTAAMGRPA